MGVIRNFTACVLTAVIVVIVVRFASGNNGRAAVSGRVRIKCPARILLIVLLGALCVHAIVIMRTEQVLPYHSIFHE